MNAENLTRAVLLSITLALTRLPLESAAAQGEPHLLVNLTPTNTLLSWPGHAVDWVLEESPDLTAPLEWQRVPGDRYQLEDGRHVVSVSPTPGSRFYRLFYLGPNVDGLAGRWRLDEGEGSTSRDGSGGDNPLLLTNTSWAAGRIGPGALQFGSGGHAWVLNDNHQVLPPTGSPFSVSLWFSPDSLSPGRSALVGNTSDGWSISLLTTGPGTNAMVLESAGSLSLTGRVTLLPERWHKLSMTFDGTAASLFLDSQPLGTATGTINAHTGPVYFGGGIIGLNSFQGRIDGIDLFDRALSREEIARTGKWSFNETGGGIAGDSGLLAHHATVGTNGWVPGHEGTGVDLRQTVLTIPNPHSSVLPPTGGSFSVSLWVYPDPEPGTWSHLLSCSEATHSGWELALMSDGAGTNWLRFWSTHSGGTLDLMTTVPIRNLEWNKLDLTFNGGIATVYVDGRKIDSDSGAIRGNTAPLMAGGFPGVIDDLQTFDRERTEAEIGPVATVLLQTVVWNTATNFTLKGAGPAGRAVTYALASEPSPTNGVITLAPGSSTVTYTAGSRKGPDAFAYTVSDGEFTSPPRLVLLSVVQPHWLSPAGGSVPPLDGSSPQKAWAAGHEDSLDAIWQTNKYYDCFFYSPGVYQTRGNKFQVRRTAHPGCKHIGSGSTGTNQTLLRLVDAWHKSGEGSFWGSNHSLGYSDNFEAHHLVLDCNAENNPKHERGEPVTIRIPLDSTAMVNTVTLRWNTHRIPNDGYGSWQFGRASEFTVSTRDPVTGNYFTNHAALNPEGTVDVIPINTETGEIVLHLTRRAAGVDFYSLGEIEVDGGTVALPRAIATGGGNSNLDPATPNHSPTLLTDNNPGTSWASGSEAEVEITLPFAAGTRLSELELLWNCQTLTTGLQLGPAETFVIEAQETNSNNYVSIPFARQLRTPAGMEIVVFGTAETPAPVVTGQLRIRLTTREPGVDRYSLREIFARNGATPVTLKIPTPSAHLVRGVSYHLMRAFDGHITTQWLSHTQGPVAAMEVMGSNLQFTHLRIIGFGSRAGSECFPVMLRTPEPHQGPIRDFGNLLMEHCIFEDPATNNTGGVSVLSMYGIPPHIRTNAIVRNCIVRGIRPHFTVSTAYATSDLENSIASDCTIGFYQEPQVGHIDVINPITLRSNLLLNVTHGIYLLFHPGSKVDSLTALNNEIVLSSSTGTGIAACDTCAGGPSGVVTNLTALNNIIRYPGWIERPSLLSAGLDASEIHNAVYGNNIVTLGGPISIRIRPCPAGLYPTPTSNLCLPDPPPASTAPVFAACLDVLPEGLRRAWFNNRDHHGTLLDVKWQNYGTLRNATQQQWP